MTSHRAKILMSSFISVLVFCSLLTGTARSLSKAVQNHQSTTVWQRWVMKCFSSNSSSGSLLELIKTITDYMFRRRKKQEHAGLNSKFISQDTRQDSLQCEMLPQVLSRYAKVTRCPPVAQNDPTSSRKESLESGLMKMQFLEDADAS